MQNKYFIFFCLIIIATCGLFSQVVSVSGTFTKKIEPNETKNFAIEQCVLLAKINALENTFGKVIFQGNSTFIQNLETGKQVESKIVFSSIGSSFVNGEWLQDTKIDTSIIHDENETYIKIDVSGKARKLSESKTNFEVYTANCAEPKCKSEQFNDGQELYLHFKSSENGFLVVYLDDPQLGITSKIIPSDEENYINVKKNINNYFPGDKMPKIVLVLSEGNEMESYKLFILFSTSPLEAPPLTDYNKEGKYITEKQKSEYLKLPLSTKSEQFQRWLQEFRLRNKTVQFEILSCFLRK